jgi:isoquinoline 1-oxidoreductase beta subunit
LGATEFPANKVENVRMLQSLIPSQIPTGPWRAPGSNAIAFVMQSFLHECAVAAGRDHVELLVEVMNMQPPPAQGGGGGFGGGFGGGGFGGGPGGPGGPGGGPPGGPGARAGGGGPAGARAGGPGGSGGPGARAGGPGRGGGGGGGGFGGGGLNAERASAVIKLAAEKAGWGRELPAGRGLGLAFHFSHSGHFAEVAEVSVDANKKITVHKVWVAGDIGPIVNMSGAENQAQGSVVDGFSTAMGLEITFENGRVQEQNFDRYPILRIANAPEVEVHFIQSDNSPTGIGEPALPPAAPAIANAVFAATGHRIRTMPFTAEGFTV